METKEEEWKQKYYQELEETPQNRAEGLKAIMQYIKENPEIAFTTDPSDEYLLRFLRARKFNHAKSFKLLSNYFLAKSRDPDLFFMKTALEDLTHIGDGWQCVLGGRTRNGQAIFVSRPGRYRLISNKSKRNNRACVTVEEAFRTNVLALEWSLVDEMTQLAGIVAIIDMDGFSPIKHSLFLSPYHSMRTTNVVQDTLPLRFGGFHVVNQPRYIDAIYALFKPFLKEKIKQRVYFHGKHFNQLHEHISPDVLPKEYGGNCGSVDDENWKERLLSRSEQILAFEPPQ